ncbi:phytoene desaturase family protein [Kurthia sibirica]|uniref:Phytoene desaturase n=1 Tax=Kurthia sibirica TaxID=202750 RepID=A0A2U3ANL7_9BACL|nr:phytoene desaturase family protein [Kurthia sibirica]PWI26115.1 phytoene desaturase [Kurthia sibirica]GEK33371.1 phytoene desaturase [Kurthia sibirica]
MKKISVVGAGPGGLTAAILLANAGYEVEVFEKEGFIGGRTSPIHIGDFTFDRGPTFVNMMYLIKEIFDLADRNLEDYVELVELTPLYDLIYNTKRLTVTSDYEQMISNIEEVFPGNTAGYTRYLQETHKKLEALVPLLQKKMDSITDLLSIDAVKALPELEIGKSLMQKLAEYFNDEELQLAFTFQSKYLGMSPWSCPGAFSILSYIEQAYGVFHIKGGVNQLTQAMATVLEEMNVKIHLNTPVKEVLKTKKKVAGLLLENGDIIYSDDVVINADFGYAMTKLLKEPLASKWTPEKVKKKQFSCSTFMLYLGLDTQYDLQHHTIMFAEDYKKNMEEISDTKILSEDMSIYIQNPVVSDSTLAPAGKSTLYVLAPVPNNFSDIDWPQIKKQYRDVLIKTLESRLDLKDLEQHIEEELVFSPQDWEQQMNVYQGATFNLGHQLSQMMTFRPHNQFKPYQNCWLVGGGTHPGSGLPIILESSRITANLILERDGIKTYPIQPLPKKVNYSIPKVPAYDPTTI